ncbi:MAG TPA: hypothetical protein VFE84_08435, partial [Patescibacteria group bacterium]|nr:hypothetical protein [Patescibacteria group bacterium]
MEKASRALLPGVLFATVLAGALRLIGLGTVPVALYCDEAFNGYEAWCLLQTGHDSHGVLLPLFFDIFGKGWSEPLYIYLTVPAVALFGLTPFAARFVAAMAGTLLVPITGLMCATLVRGQVGPRTAARAGVAASILMAISPWPFHLSRVAFQASLLPLALAAGFWLAARAVSDAVSDRANVPPRVRPGLLAAGALLLGLSLYTYTISRLAMPLMVAGFIWLHRRRISASRRAWLLAALVLASLALPIAAFSLSTRGQQRFSSVAINRREDLQSAGPLQIAAAAGANYLSYYS